jgi:N utilization substance protein A
MIKHEVLMVADVVAREKGIEKHEVLEAIEEAIEKAGNAKYGQEHHIKAHIDPLSGYIRLVRCLTVVEEVLEDNIEISLKDAQKINPEATIGFVLEEELPPIDFGRVAAQTAKQVIYQKVRDAERLKQYTEFKDRIGEIVNGTVKRVEYGNVFVEIGRTEAFMRKDELIARETYRVGDRIRAVITDVRNEPRGPQVFLSRVSPLFLIKLFTQEVPEIYDGDIEIKAVARDPGSRAKMAVHTTDPSLDPLGTCVGVRGSRVQAVVAELQGEKIDIIIWSPNIATFVVNALTPAEVSKIVLDEDTHRAEVIVAEDQLSLAIGRRGQNVRLTSQLTGWNIDIIGEDEEAKRRQKEFGLKSALFIEALDVDEIIAQLLFTEGFESIEDIINTNIKELIAIEGFDEEIATELRTRASEYLRSRNADFDTKILELGVKEEEFKVVPGLTKEHIFELAKNNIKTLDDLADLSGDELIDLIGKYSINYRTANDMIMAARAHWFLEE